MASSQCSTFPKLLLCKESEILLTNVIHWHCVIILCHLTWWPLHTFSLDPWKRIISVTFCCCCHYYCKCYLLWILEKYIWIGRPHPVKMVLEFCLVFLLIWNCIKKKLCRYCKTGFFVFISHKYQIFLIYDKIFLLYMYWKL